MVGESLSFGGVADRYDRARPGYPSDAVHWLIGDQQARVIELGAGTGKLTESLVDLDHLVLATDPDERMLHHLRLRRPDAHAVAGRAERIPAANRSADVVVAAQALHWFDLSLAVPEMARVLRPGGVLALVWNQRDESVPWVKKLGRLIGAQGQRMDLPGGLDGAVEFGELETRVYRHWQTLDRRGLLDLAASRSNLASMGEDERDERLEQVGALYDDYDRGPDGLQLPYLTRCFRAVLERPAPPPPRTPPARGAIGEPTQAMNRADLPTKDGPGPPESRDDDPDDGTLLIDFH